MVDWLTISQASGSGNATITITASTYSGLIDRATSLKVSTVSSAISKYVTVQQTAQQPFTASPSSISDGGLGGTYQIEITSSHEWTATTVPAWVTLSQNSGSAGTVITVTLPENQGADRTASLVFTDVKGRTATVSLTQYEVTVPVDDCLTIEFEENGQVTWITRRTNAQYKKNDGGWEEYDYSFTPIQMQSGETISFRSDFAASSTWTQFECTGSCITYGNPLSLYYGSSFTGQTQGDPVLDDLSYLFSGNSGLTDASGLYIPQVTGSYMFKDCINLVKAPKKLPTSFSSSGYEQYFSYMFSGCTSLTTPPMLPALTLDAVQVYEGMFEGCMSLVNAPSLPATAITQGCYRGMFSGCTSLVNAPSELPAAALAYGCYTNMFYGCTSLQRAPELPADYRITDMCDQMFYGCSSLNYIKCLTTKRKSGANQIWADNWVNGVNASGTFVKSSDATTWATGVHGIPSGWTVVDA